jgi:hypothetical protein
MAEVVYPAECQIEFVSQESAHCQRHASPGADLNADRWFSRHHLRDSVKRGVQLSPHIDPDREVASAERGYGGVGGC